MDIGKLLRGTALAMIVASFGFAAAQAEVYDGISYPQFKSILSKTNLGLTEKLTEKGNRYLLVMVPGWTVPFVATSAACGSSQDHACDGFAFFFVDTGSTMSASAMGQFNSRSSFIKIFPAAGRSIPVIKGEYYARGGITDQNVLSAGAYFSVVLQHYLEGSGASAMNSQMTAPAFAFTDTAQPEKFFAELAKRGSPHSVPVGDKASMIDESMIDAVVSQGPQVSDLGR